MDCAFFDMVINLGKLAFEVLVVCLGFLLGLQSSHRKTLGHHEVGQKLHTTNFRFFQRTMLRIYLGRKLVDEVEEELVISTAVSIVVDSQKDAMGVLFGVKTK